MKVHMAKAVILALTVYVLLNTLFFLLSVSRPIDLLQRILYSLPVPIVLGIVPVILLRNQRTGAEASNYQWIVILGVIGGFAGSILIAGLIVMPESYFLRMVLLNVSQIIAGAIAQVLLVYIPGTRSHHRV